MEYSEKLRNSSEKFKTQAKTQKLKQKTQGFDKLKRSLAKTGRISKPDLNAMLLCC